MQTITHRRKHRAPRAVAGAIILAGALLGPGAGCQQQTQNQPANILGPLDVLGVMRKPIRVGETTIEFTLPPVILPKRELLRLGMAEHLKEPVQLELMTTRQIRVHLSTGRMSFALVRPHEFTEVAQTGSCEILAVPLNKAGQTHRQGLLVVAPKSPVKTVADMKGIRFHFMPRGDLLNDAALGALMETGIPVKEVDKSLLGLGLDTFHINSLEVAKSVVLENGAGVIDEADYNRWPEKGGSFILLSPSRDQVRVVGKTIRIPEGPFVCSTHVSPELKQRMSEFLFKVAPNKYKLALAAMDARGFAPPIGPEEYQAFHDFYRKLHPLPREERATMPSSEGESQPAENP